MRVEYFFFKDIEFIDQKITNYKRKENNLHRNPIYFLSFSLSKKKNNKSTSQKQIEPTIVKNRGKLTLESGHTSITQVSSSSVCVVKKFSERDHTPNNVTEGRGRKKKESQAQKDTCPESERRTSRNRWSARGAGFEAISGGKGARVT